MFQASLEKGNYYYYLFPQNNLLVNEHPNIARIFVRPPMCDINYRGFHENGSLGYLGMRLTHIHTRTLAFYNI